jgi:hypothetical protein
MSQMRAELFAAGLLVASCGAREASWPPSSGVRCTGDIASDSLKLANELDMLARTADPKTVGPIEIAEVYERRVREGGCSPEAVRGAQDVLNERDNPYADERDI